MLIKNHGTMRPSQKSFAKTSFCKVLIALLYQKSQSKIVYEFDLSYRKYHLLYVNFIIINNVIDLVYSSSNLFLISEFAKWPTAAITYISKKK